VFYAVIEVMELVVAQSRHNNASGGDNASGRPRNFKRFKKSGAKKKREFLFV